MNPDAIKQEQRERLVRVIVKDICNEILWKRRGNVEISIAGLGIHAPGDIRTLLPSIKSQLQEVILQPFDLEYIPSWNWILYPLGYNTSEKIRLSQR